MKQLTAILLGASLLFATACSDDAPPDDPPDASPVIDADPNQPDAPPATTSHAADIQPIWDANCVICHANFLTDPAYGTIVNTVSGQHGTMNRITPGDPSQSYIWHKINDTHLANGGSGNVMPPPGAGTLQQDDIDLIELWIMEGAPE